MGLEKELETAKKLAVAAGKKAMQFYEEGNEIFAKDDSSPLTSADTASNSTIMSGLRKRFPDDGFLTEEEKDTPDRLAKDRVWIVDPLDGTKEFIKKTGDFTVNIALAVKGKPVLGVVFVPARNQLYYAAAGKGSFVHDGKKEDEVSVSGRKKTGEMTLVMSRDHATEQEKKLAERFAKTASRGSSLKGLMVAEGSADAYFRAGPVNQWDICAMDAILTEAGGTLTDLIGNRIKYNTPETLIKGFLATNSKAHREILGIIREIQKQTQG